MLWHLEPTIWGEIAPLRFSQFLEIANDFPQEGTFHMQAKQSRPHIWTTSSIWFLHSRR